MYETAQERVIELSGELNALRSESDTASEYRCYKDFFVSPIISSCSLLHILTSSLFSGKRGNSLFAEVDDQRQKMKVLLTAQKANYIEVSCTIKMFLLNSTIR